MKDKNIENKIYTMKAYKYDGREHYEQQLQLVERDDRHLVLSGSKGRKLIHHTRDAVYTFDEETLEYFFTDRWYTAALVFDDTGKVIHVYCNIACPSVIKDEIVEFTDLDVDVVVIDGIIEVIDIDEFNEHRELYGYSSKLEKKVFDTVRQVKNDIEQRIFPFNRDILKEY